MLDEINCRYIADNKIVELSIAESRILKILIDNKNRVVKYSEISMLLYGLEDRKGRISARIHSLRKKLNSLLEIKTKISIGYYIK